MSTLWFFHTMGAEFPTASAVRASSSSSLSGGRPLVALRTGIGGGFGIGLPMGTSRARHVATKAGQDVRLVFNQPLAAEGAGSNSIRVKAGIEVQDPYTSLDTGGISTGGPITALPVIGIGSTILAGTLLTVTSGAHTQVFTTTGTNFVGSGSINVTSLTPNFNYPAGSVISMPTIFPVTFNGRQTAVLEPDGSVVSDSVAIELTVGQVFWSRTYISVPLFTNGGTDGYALTNAPSNIGDTTIQSAVLIPNPEPAQIVLIDQGGSAELAVFASPAVSGAGPYTYKFTAPLTKAHSSGATFGQQVPTNMTLYSDLGEGTTAGADLAWVATAIPVTNGSISGTLSASSNINDTVVQSNSQLPGSTFTIDTAGLLETVTVRTMQGSTAPFRYYLTAPLAQAHASGVAIVSTALFNVAGFIPNAIVADRLVPGDTPKSVIIMASDSIAQGTGHSRNQTSFATIALDAAQIAYINTAKAGEALYQYTQPPVSMRRRKLITMGTWALIQGITNDIYGGRTLAQLQADFQASCLLAKKRGLLVAACTCIPRSTSSDFWMTPGNQSISGAGTQRVPYNTWLRAWQSNGLKGAYVDALFDLCTVCEVNAAGVLTLDAGLWIANAAGPYTADGIHPTPLGHALLATAITAGSFT